jgi:hypothetical protein
VSALVHEKNKDSIFIRDEYTHKYIKSFISLSIPEPQAEAMTGFVRDTKEYNVYNFAHSTPHFF